MHVFLGCWVRCWSERQRMWCGMSGVRHARRLLQPVNDRRKATCVQEGHVCHDFRSTGGNASCSGLTFPRRRCAPAISAQGGTATVSAEPSTRGKGTKHQLTTCPITAVMHSSRGHARYTVLYTFKARGIQFLSQGSPVSPRPLIKSSSLKSGIDSRGRKALRCIHTSLYMVAVPPTHCGLV